VSNASATVERCRALSPLVAVLNREDSYYRVVDCVTALSSESFSSFVTSVNMFGIECMECGRYSLVHCAALTSSVSGTDRECSSVASSRTADSQSLVDSLTVDTARVV